LSSNSRTLQNLVEHGAGKGPRKKNHKEEKEKKKTGLDLVIRTGQTKRSKSDH